MSRNKILRWMLFAILLVSLLTALAPLTDIDHDGWPDSLITEGVILPPVLLSVTLLVVLMTLVFALKPRLPESLSSRINPPPISN